MKNKDFLTYEYMSKTVKANEQAQIADMYEAFGWEITGVNPAVADSVTLSFKRDRKLPHKQELARLERQAEETFTVLTRLESAKTKGSMIFALVFGCIAALVLGGGMSLVLLHSGSVAAWVGGIALGLVGIVLCGINYPLYRKAQEKKTRQLSPAIDENEEKLANLLEKGNDLLQGGVL